MSKRIQLKSHYPKNNSDKKSATFFVFPIGIHEQLLHSLSHYWAVLKNRPWLLVAW